MRISSITQFELDIVIKNLRNNAMILKMNPFEDAECVVTIQCILRIYGFRYGYKRAVDVLAEFKKQKVILS